MTHAYLLPLSAFAIRVGTPVSGFGLGFGVSGSGFRVEGSKRGKNRIWGLGFSEGTLVDIRVKRQRIWV